MLLNFLFFYLITCVLFFNNQNVKISVFRENLKVLSPKQRVPIDEALKRSLNQRKFSLLWPYFIFKK